jgi:hypothetical protein
MRTIEAFDQLNATVFNIGSEFINFDPAGLDDFLTPRRTLKPRTMRVGLKFTFDGQIQCDARERPEHR